MQVVFHLGAPCTDDDRLIKSLLKNREALAKDGVAVPTPALYREVIKDTLRALDGAPAPAEMSRTILDVELELSEMLPRGAALKESDDSAGEAEPKKPAILQHLHRPRRGHRYRGRRLRL